MPKSYDLIETCSLDHSSQPTARARASCACLRAPETYAMAICASAPAPEYAEGGAAAALAAAHKAVESVVAWEREGGEALGLLFILQFAAVEACGLGLEENQRCSALSLLRRRLAG
eukprot:5898609-Pleurochrysis_carterae.AAC.5